MSPIIDLQLRLRQLGTLRMGELTTRNGKTYPSSRETWRVTTSDEKIAAQVATLFGGEAKEWDSKSAERLVVDTDAVSLPIAVVPGHALSQYWELWGGGGCLRRCDGEEELLSGTACLCDPEARECKPTTRLSVVVRGVDALGLFRLNTGGYYAAVELGGAAQFLETRTARGEVLEGWLRIEERRVVRAGQTKVFKVPTLDVAYGIDRMLPVGQAQAALEPGYTPIASIDPGVSVQQGLKIVEQQTATRTSRSAAPIPAADDLDFGGPVPVPEEPGATPAPAADEDGKVTADQKTALNALHGELLRAEKITNEQMYAAAARMRDVEVDDMIVILEGRKQNGDLSFAKLRDSLTKQEASSLIDRLGRLADNVKTGAAA